VKRRLTWIVVFVGLTAVVVMIGFVGIGYVAYDELSKITVSCENPVHRAQTPASFVAGTDDGQATVDTAPYRFTDYDEVAFPSRDPDLTIRSWFAPGPGGIDDPVVVLVHGRASCRRDPNILLPAGMLHRAGFGVLLIDLRNHGESDADNYRWAGGDKEYRDVLGAWDWLRSRGHPAERIGLFGASLGAATVVLATGREPEVAATWADSSYADVTEASTEYAVEHDYPGWVSVPAVLIGRIIGDPELATDSPDEAATRLAGRPLFIVQGLEDETVLAHHAIDLAHAAAIGGTMVEPWIVPRAGHTEEMYFVPDEYERRLVEFFATALAR
jgi:dipeptidyl aminopeptidase/acylaminoacyl peptidase